MRDLSSSLDYLAIYFKSLAGDEPVILAPQALAGFAQTFAELKSAAIDLELALFNAQTTLRLALVAEQTALTRSAVEIEREKARLEAAVSDGVAAGAVIDLREAMARERFPTASGGDAA